MDEDMKDMLYDPPAGWLYGFPKPYKPLPGERIRDTLLRDGYPEKLLNNMTREDGGVMGVRFIGPMK